MASCSDIAGIVLIGGKSKRMGRPKALMHYDGDLLYHKTAILLDKFLGSVYISGTKSQREQWDIKDFDFIPDTYFDIGPIAGILSAFSYLEKEKCALLIVATDMPFLNDQIISKLLTGRNKDKLASIFRNEKTGFLEPLCAIYEFASFTKMKKAVKNKLYAIHKVFDKNDIEYLDFDKNEALTNINYPGQLDLLKD